MAVAKEATSSPRQTMPDSPRSRFSHGPPRSLTTVEHADPPQSHEYRDIQDLAGQDHQPANDQRSWPVGCRSQPVPMGDPPGHEHQALEALERDEQSREHVHRRGCGPPRRAQLAEAGGLPPDRHVGDALEAENDGRNPEDLLVNSGHDVGDMTKQSVRGWCDVEATMPCTPARYGVLPLGSRLMKKSLESRDKGQGTRDKGQAVVPCR